MIRVAIYNLSKRCCRVTIASVLQMFQNLMFDMTHEIGCFSPKGPVTIVTVTSNDG